MRASYAESRRYLDRKASDVDLAAAGVACRFRAVEVSSQFARFCCAMSWKSWGEIIQLHVSDTEGAVQVDVDSVCAAWVQIEDWGKNRDNVQRMFDAIEATLGSCAAANVPRCARCGYQIVATEPDRCPECGARERVNAASPLLGGKLRSIVIRIGVITGVEIGLINAIAMLPVAPAVVRGLAGFGGAVRLVFINGAVGAVMLIGARRRSVAERGVTSSRVDRRS